MNAIFQFIARNPWVYVVLAFVLLIGAWGTLIVIASNHPTREIKVEPAPHKP